MFNKLDSARRIAREAVAAARWRWRRYAVAGRTERDRTVYSCSVVLTGYRVSGPGSALGLVYGGEGLRAGG